MSTINMPRKNDKPIIAGTWMAGGNKEKTENKTVVLAIPNDIAIKYDIYKRTSVLITPTNKGILIKRLQVLEE
jgi:hypothetical protein